MTLPTPARLVALALASTLALGMAACGDDGAADGPTRSTTPTVTSAAVGTATTLPPTPTIRETVIEVEFRNGSVVGGARRERIDTGDTVRLRVMSDVADEVHVHGYDERTPVAAGGTAELSFVADSGGQFEVELESRHRTLLTLQVG